MNGTSLSKTDDTTLHNVCLAHFIFIAHYYIIIITIKKIMTKLCVSRTDVYN